ncbi:DNA repair exonuclease [Facklamia sp. DSM 111018]|uniref:DNA repair exonuclease n=1 Tax=Facklamia lactis TaxID=2749967 RepID=A0ABS0LRD5_9LACT|nr:DNA repair exonuclease [Facklamia lactis]MBG9980207.1 DNA repair exonuclease [Facklamia lactis]MBG9986010.1 DNA repair exonuclease [Facklamia lactis]
MRFMHISDLHLDSPFVGMQKDYPQLQEILIQAPFKAFQDAVSIAIKEQLDAVIIVGDIYDTQRQTIYAQHFFVKQLKRLNEASIPVVICHGNHDYLENQRMPMQYPENVFVFTNQKIDYVDINFKDKTTGRFYGFSYQNRWIHERKVREFPRNPKETDYVIGLYHGSEEGMESLAGHYAPFAISEMINKDYDYWALGHIHQDVLLNEAPPIRYSGTPQGRNRLEVGDKGAYIVSLELNRPPQLKFVSLASVIWRNEMIDCQEDWQANDLVESINNLVETYQKEVDLGLPSQIISLTLTNAQRLPIALQEQIEAGELDSVLPEPQSEDSFVVVIRICLERQMRLEAFEYDQRLKMSFQNACQNVQEGSAYSETMQDLWDHPLIRKWLPDLENDSSLKQDIVHSAQELMIQAIGFEFKEAEMDEN